MALRGLGLESGIKNQESRDGVPKPVDNGMRLTGKRKLVVGVLAGLIFIQLSVVLLPPPGFIEEANWGSPAREVAPWVLTALYVFFFFQDFGGLMALGFIVLGALVWTGRLDRLAVRAGQAWSKLHLESETGNL